MNLILFYANYCNIVTAISNIFLVSWNKYVSAIFFKGVFHFLRLHFLWTIVQSGEINKLKRLIDKHKIRPAFYVNRLELRIVRMEDSILWLAQKETPKAAINQMDQFSFASIRF